MQVRGDIRLEVGRPTQLKQRSPVLPAAKYSSLDFKLVLAC